MYGSGSGGPWHDSWHTGSPCRCAGSLLERPKIDVAEFQRALQTYDVIGISYNAKVGEFIKSIERFLSYSPSGKNRELRLAYRTLQRLSDPINGILTKERLGYGRFVYHLRLDWRDQAQQQSRGKKQQASSAAA